MVTDQEARQFRLLTAHCVLWSFAMSLASGFVGAYLLQLGFSVATTILLYAMLLAIRFLMRTIMLPVVRRIGMRRTIILGTAISAFQFLPLVHADKLRWLAAWIMIVATGECIYWPIYHAANAVCGGGEHRGRQLATRQMARTAISVVGPVAGGLLLTRFGPGAEFGLATVVCLVSITPLLFIGELGLGPIPTVRQSLRVPDPVGLSAFVADGWISAGIYIAWPMILFATLGSSYDLLGWATSAAAIAGAVAGLACGRAIDRGHRRALSRIVTAALLIGIAMRAASNWAPEAAFAANLAGAAIGGLYYPLLMSVVYDRAKRSGSAYRFHLSTEAGWDTGAILGCLAAAAVAASGAPITLAVLPSALGAMVIHRCVRAEARATSRAKVAVMPA
jgi:MFS family permease